MVGQRPLQRAWQRSLTLSLDLSYEISTELRRSPFAPANAPFEPCLKTAFNGRQFIMLHSAFSSMQISPHIFCPGPHEAETGLLAPRPILFFTDSTHLAELAYLPIVAIAALSMTRPSRMTALSVLLTLISFNCFLNFGLALILSWMALTMSASVTAEQSTFGGAGFAGFLLLCAAKTPASSTNASVRRTITCLVMD